MDATTIIAVRHGETEWNKAGRQQGHRDSPLTALGRAQAAAMGAGLKGFRIDMYYSSDLGRAVETARIISGEIGLPFATDVRLRERHLGVLQGLTMAAFAEQYPAEAALFRGPDPDYRIPGGESVRDRCERSVAAAGALAAGCPGGTMLIVAHGGTLMSFMHRALGLPLSAERTYSLFNGAINRFAVAADGTWRLESWGETGHLRAAGLSFLDDA
jgi:2,3-bisphosphoglycerate-dependent phosphoglycerate mutase